MSTLFCIVDNKSWGTSSSLVELLVGYPVNRQMCLKLGNSKPNTRIQWLKREYYCLICHIFSSDTNPSSPQPLSTPDSLNKLFFEDTNISIVFPPETHSMDVLCVLYAFCTVDYGRDVWDDVFLIFFNSVSSLLYPSFGVSKIFFKIHKTVVLFPFELLLFS